MRPLLAAADLLVGAACPVCGAPTLSVCAPCLERIRPAPVVVQDAQHADDLLVVAGGWYRSGLRQVVVDWKEHGRFPLTTVLSHHLALAVAAVVGESDRVELVPVPTSWRARWRRGDDLVRQVALGAADRLRATGCAATVRPTLVHARRTADQAGLRAQERASNLSGAFAVRGVPARPTPEVPLVVVDDVVTTGATLAEAVRALQEVRWSVTGAAAIAATPAPGQRPASGLR